LDNPTPAARRSVLYYVERYLPASQAFIAQQAKALTRYRPSFLAGSRIPSPSASIANFDVSNIAASKSMRLGELALKIGRIPVAPLFPSLSKADLVHAHFGKNGYVIAPLAAAAGKPLVTTFHGFDATYDGDPRKPGGFNQVRFFRHGRAQMAASRNWNIAVSDFIADRLRALGFAEDRIRRMYVGIDPAIFRPKGEARIGERVVSVARFVEYKGHKYMIDALAEVVRGGIPIQFVMIGQGPLRDKVESHARAVLPDVQIFDSLSQAEIASILGTAKIYLHGSVTLENGHAEAFGLANLEAQAAGVPVVAFRSGGVTEAMIDGQTGIAVAEKDIHAMAAAVAALLRDQQRWDNYSRAALAMVSERFDIGRQTLELEDFYDEVLETHTQSADMNR
jgi:colanic acid/amylovoran biosynthesis glycosyltransferase